MKQLFALVVFLCLSLSGYAQQFPQDYPMGENLGSFPHDPTPIMVAASNTPLTDGQRPSITCTGTNDQACINRAIAACGDSVSGVPGCKVVLMQGVFNVNSTVSPIIIDNDDVELTSVSGCMWGGYTQPFGGTSKPAGAVGNGCAQIRDSGTGKIIEIQHNNAGGTGSDTIRHRGIRIDNLYIVGNAYTSTYGIADVGAHPDDNVFIQNNIIQKTIQPIYVNLDAGDISFNSLQDNLGSAISNVAFGGCCYIRIHNNLIFDGGSTGDTYQNSYGIVNFSTGAVISDNIIGDYYGGIYAYGFHSVVTGNSLGGIAGKFINLGFSRGDVVSGNSFDNWDTTPGYVISSYLSGSAPAISCLSGTGTLGATITGNTFDIGIPTTGAAIDFTNCPGALAVGNTFMGPWGSGTTPTVAGTNSLIANNNNVFVPASTPATVTSALLMGRWVASALGLSNGATVPNFYDQSGLGNTMIGSGTITYQTASNVNSHPAVRFNSSTAYYTCSSCYTAQTSTARTYFGVFNYAAAPTGSNTAGLFNAGLGYPAIYINSSNQVCVFAGSTACNTAATLTVGNSYIVEVAVNGASTRISVNGSVQTVNAGTASASYNYNSFHMGGGGSASNAFTGDLAETDMYYLQMSSADAASVASALSAAYGITITSGSANW